MQVSLVHCLTPITTPRSGERSDRREQSATRERGVRSETWTRNRVNDERSQRTKKTDIKIVTLENTTLRNKS